MRILITSLVMLLVGALLGFRLSSITGASIWIVGAIIVATCAEKD
jgi:hypothetical protein